MEHEGKRIRVQWFRQAFLLMRFSLKKNKQTKAKGKSVNYQFDEATKSLAQSVTRRAALKKFGVVMDNRIGGQRK